MIASMNQQAIIARQTAIALQRISGGGIMYGPNGAMLPGEMPVQPNPSRVTLDDIVASRPNP